MLKMNRLKIAKKCVAGVILGHQPKLYQTRQ